MEEEKNKKINSSDSSINKNGVVKKTTRKKTTSTKKKTTTRKKVAVELSNDEILDRIISKKTQKKKTIAKKTAARVAKAQNVSNDELFEQIMAKKAEKAEKKAKKGQVVNKKNVTNDIVKTIVEEEDKFDKTQAITDIYDFPLELPKLKENSTEPKEKEENNNKVKKSSKKDTKEKKSKIYDQEAEEKQTKTEEPISLIELTRALVQQEQERKRRQFEQPRRQAIKTKKVKSKPKIEEEPLIITSFKTKKKNKIHINKRNLLILSLLLALIFVICFTLLFKKEKSDNKSNEVKIESKKSNEDKETLYKNCLTRAIDNKDTSEEIASYLDDLDTYLSDYDVSVSYEDLNLGYSYLFKPNETYYAASTIKALDALYMYTLASEGQIDLDETMTYTKKYRWGASAYMKNIKYGTKVKLRDLVKYAVKVSDNSAHQMLISYIGYSKLKEFGENLGATKTLSGYDNFGYINVDDAIIYMKALNEFFNNGGELGEELKQIFLEADQNDLALPAHDIQAAHKYGQYSEVYHDIGIVYDKNPYVIAILTKEGNRKDYEQIIKDINEHVYKLHTLYHNNRENICQNEIYNKKKN